MPQGTRLCGNSRCARGWAQPHGGGDRAEPSPEISLAGGTPPPAPANKQRRAACSVAEQLLPTNTQVATVGRRA